MNIAQIKETRAYIGEYKLQPQDPLKGFFCRIHWIDLKAVKN